MEAAAQQLTMWRVEEARLTEVRMKGAPVCPVKPFFPPHPGNSTAAAGLVIRLLNSEHGGFKGSLPI